MDEQQRINLALMRELAAQGIGFAFPTRTVHLVASAAPAAGSGIGIGIGQAGVLPG
ncbi:hypothetical protein D3C87_2037510 [compost metagenome]